MANIANINVKDYWSRSILRF